MIRDVDLVSYLPAFLAEFAEDAAALGAEDPEFRIVWEGTDRVLKNEFIATADEYGISRFERLLHIYPSSEDTLESRRARVQIRWFNSIPYTWRVFLDRLTVICGENNFKATAHFVDGYLVELELFLELLGQIEEVERMIETMFPANITFGAMNSIPCNAEGVALFGGGACYVQKFLVTNDGKETHVITGSTPHGGGLGWLGDIFVTDGLNETVNVGAEALYGGAAAGVERIGVSNDFNEQFKTGGDALAGAGTVVAQFFEINNEQS